MKKSLVLTILIVLINACAVPKKEYYIFDRYTPKKVTHPEQSFQERDTEPNLTLSPQSKTFPVLKAEEISTMDRPSLSQAQTNAAKRQRTKTGTEVNQQSLPTVAKHTDTYLLKPVQPESLPAHRKSGDRILLFAAALIGLSVMTAIRIMRPVTKKVTRWASTNPRKTQGLIAAIHLPLLGLGVMNGYNLDQLGYDVSNPLLYGAGAAALAGFAAAPYVRHKDWMVLPRTVNRNRMAFLGIVLSTLLLTIGVGNKIERNFQDTYLASTVRSMDQTIFTPSFTNDSDPVNVEKAQAKVKQDRKAKAGMSAGSAFFLTFLLVLLACTGVCLVIGGLSGAFATGGASVAAVIGGLGLLALSIYGIDQVSRKRKLEKERENAQGL